MSTLPKNTEVKITLPDGRTYEATALDIGTFGDGSEFDYGLIKWDPSEPMEEGNE